MAATASARRQALADLARARKGEGSAGRMIGWIAVTIILLGLLGLAVLWLAGFFTTPKEVLAVRTVVDTQIVELGRMARGEVPYSEESGSFGPLMKVARQVPERYLEREFARLGQARAAAEIDSYFVLPPDRRTAELDRRIKAEEARRAGWEAERAQREARRGEPGGPSGATAVAGGQRRRRGPGTEESRNAWVKRYIDGTTADGRARRTEYRRAKDQRRIELGLEPRR